MLSGFPRIKRPPATIAKKPVTRMIAFAGLATAAAALYFLLPDSSQRLPPVPMADAEIAALLPRFAAAQPKAADSGAARAMALLGQKLFNDKSLSRDGTVACATCHDPAKAFTDGKRVAHGLADITKNTPTVVNTYLATWFYWDGRADSLAAQALGPLEEPREHGFSRGQIAAALKTRYAADYAAAFGAWPAHFPTAKLEVLSAGALPAPRQLAPSIDVAAYGLATLGAFSLLSDVLTVAESHRVAPASELGRRAFAGPLLDAKAVQNYAALSDDEKNAVDAVFANAGRAFAAYESGLSAVESPFDRFAARVAKGATMHDAMDVGFGDSELAGLKFFVGPGRCVLCHDGPQFSDQQFHNPGLAALAVKEGGLEPSAFGAVDLGRAAGVLRVVADPFNCAGKFLPADAAAPGTNESCRELPFLATQNLELVGAFKTPGLRLVDLTAPYMHDGRFATLAEVINHYDEMDDKPAAGHREESLKPLHLTDENKMDLIAFLKALTSPIRDANAPSLAGK